MYHILAHNAMNILAVNGPGSTAANDLAYILWFVHNFLLVILSVAVKAYQRFISNQVYCSPLYV